MADAVSFQAKQLILKMKRFKSNSELARSLLGDLRMPYTYKEELEELSMCQAMLDLLKDVLHLLHTNPNRDVRIRCSLIVSLLLRQEFKYKRILHYQRQTFSDISAALPANTASRYFQLLCKAVEWATNTLNKRTISASTLQGCMKLLAICYYRLPKFGEIVREIVQKQVRELEAIVEPRVQAQSTQRILAALDEYTNVADAVGRSVTDAYRQQHGDLFLWSKLAEGCDYRLALPSNQRWKRHVCIFDEGFSQFLGSVVKLITHHFREDSSEPCVVLWHAIPGYTMMLKRYVFSNVDVQRYCCRNTISRSSRQTFNQRQVKAILDCSYSLLDNHDLLNLFTVVTFECTNVHNLLNVEHALTQIEVWFRTVGEQNTQQASNIYLSGLSKWMQHPQDGVPRSPRGNFTGADAVAWLLKREARAVVDEQTAVHICCSMVRRGVINSVGNDEEIFRHDATQYRWATQQFAEMEDNAKGTRSLPKSFDLDYFTRGICQLLGAEHFQVVLKALSFVYNQEVLFHGAFRIKLINGVLLKGFFFQLFLHWMHEIRKYFLHILVFKTFRTPRLQLPCSTDQELQELAQHLGQKGAAASSSASDKKSKSNFFSRFKKNLITLRSRNKSKRSWWADIRTALSTEKVEAVTRGAMDAVFHESLDSEQQAVDLMLASKLDSYVQLTIQQHRSKADLGNFPRRLHVYIPSTLREYSKLLDQYYAYVISHPGDTIPPCPHLQFNVLCSDGEH